MKEHEGFNLLFLLVLRLLAIDPCSSESVVVVQ